MSRWCRRGVDSGGNSSAMNSFLSVILGKMTYVKVAEKTASFFHPEGLQPGTGPGIFATRILTDEEARDGHAR